jgi:hypothetical protein
MELFTVQISLHIVPHTPLRHISTLPSVTTGSPGEGNSPGVGGDSVASGTNRTELVVQLRSNVAVWKHAQWIWYAEVIFSIAVE